MLMPNIKHVGRLKTSKRRVIVPYRTIPNDPHSCLVVFVDTLSSDEHDSLIRVVESAAGQQSYELAEVMNRSFLPDGRNMLVGFYKTGKLQKIATADVEMIPNSTASIGLDELNQLIAQQRGVSLDQLPLTADHSATNQAAVEQPVLAAEPAETTEPAAVAQPLSDADLAKQFRSQADALFKEAQRLRKQADELAPAKKPTTSVKKPAAKTRQSA
jgi:hypothetical protein